MSERHRGGSVLLELTTVAALLSRLLGRELASEGRRMIPHGALLALVHILGPITPSNLERESGIPGATLRRMVQALVDEGYVRRLPNPDDRRSYFLDSTKRAERALDAVVPAMRAVEERIEAVAGSSLEDLRPGLANLRRAAQSLLADEVNGRLTSAERR